MIDKPMSLAEKLSRLPALMSDESIPEASRLRNLRYALQWLTRDVDEALRKIEDPDPGLIDRLIALQPQRY